MDLHSIEGVSVIEQWSAASTLGFATFNTLTFGHMVKATHVIERYYNIMIDGVHTTSSNNLAMGTNNYDIGPSNNFVAAYLDEISKICVFKIDN